MSQLRHATPRHIQLPAPQQLGVSNQVEIERFSRADANGPLCFGATGDPGTIAAGAPGALSTVTWTENTNELFDLYKILNPADTTTLRIPMDGTYHLFTNWFVGDNPGSNVEIEARWDVAPTSISGFTSPVFTVAGPLASKTILANPVIDTRFPHNWFGVELHANDLLRYRVRVNGVALTATTVVNSEFRFMSPIPVDR